MITKSFRSRFIVFFALFFGAFSLNQFAQTVKAEKNGTVAGYLRGADEDAGSVGKRTIESGKINSAVKPAAEQIFEFEKQAFSLVNQKRAENGLPPIAWSEEIAKIARIHSENMVKFKFFSHRGADGKMVDERADEIGLTRWTMIGENIAYNRGYKNPVETAVEKWMLSPTHRENILSDRWKESAIGIAIMDDGTYYFTQVFLKRK